MDKNNTGRSRFEKNKKIICFIISFLKIFPINFRKKFLNWFRNSNSTFGLLMRYCLLKTVVKSLGDNVFIGTNIEFKGFENLSIGNNVSIHKDCYIDASGGLKIGNDVSIAHNTSIISSNHTWDDEKIPIKYNPVITKKIEIADDVWIGAKVIVLAGCEIASRVVIAAGSVVTKNVETHTLIAGVPAKEIKKI